jgi:hypothetical protein
MPGRNLRPRTAGCVGDHEEARNRCQKPRGRDHNPATSRVERVSRRIIDYKSVSGSPTTRELRPSITSQNTLDDPPDRATEAGDRATSNTTNPLGSRTSLLLTWGQRSLPRLQMWRQRSGDVRDGARLRRRSWILFVWMLGQFGVCAPEVAQFHKTMRS